MPNPTIPATNYSAPNGAIWVATNGNDNTGNGSESNPYKTLNKAHAEAPINGTSTIVLKEGTYRNVSLDINKKVTIQPEAGKEVWLKGSTSFPGSDWTLDNGNYKLNVGSGFEFTPIPATDKNVLTTGKHPAHPRARYYERVYVNGIQRKLVLTKSELDSNTFYHDRDNDVYWLSDNPAGKTTEIVGTYTGLVIKQNGAGSVIRGLGIAQYGYAGIKNEQTAGSLTISKCAMIGGRLCAELGLGAIKNNFVVEDSFFYQGGQRCVGANGLNNMQFRRNTVEGGRFHDFVEAQSSAGVKFGDIHNSYIYGNKVNNNFSTGLWIDVDSTNIYIHTNESKNNHRNGIFYEISEDGYIFNNVVESNGEKGIQVHDSIRVRVFNNTCVKNPINFSYQNSPHSASRPYRTSSIESYNNLSVDQIYSPFLQSTEANNIFGFSLQENEGGTEALSTYFSDISYNAYYKPSTNTAKTHRVNPKPAGVAASTFASLAAFKQSYQSFEGNSKSGTYTVTQVFTDYANGDYHVKTGLDSKGAAKIIPQNLAAMIGVSPSGNDIGAITFIDTPVTPPPADPAIVTSFDLYDTQEKIIQMSAGLNLYQVDYPDGFTFVTEVNSVTTEVKFYLDGGSTPYRTETVAPYSFNGDSTTGGVTTYAAVSLSPGTHTVKAIPYSGTTAGSPVEYTFNLYAEYPKNPQFTGDFDVYDTTAKVLDLVNGQQISLSTYPNFTFVIEGNEDVTSVEFYLNGSLYSTQTAAPFAMNGTTNSGTTFTSMGLGVGNYTIRAVPKNGTVSGTPLEVSFSVLQNTGSTGLDVRVRLYRMSDNSAPQNVAITELSSGQTFYTNTDGYVDFLDLSGSPVFSVQRGNLTELYKYRLWINNNGTGVGSKTAVCNETTKSTPSSGIVDFADIPNTNLLVTL